MTRRTKHARALGPIHERIGKFKDKQGWTLEEFGAALGVDKTTVQHWVVGISSPSAPLLPALADLMGVSVATLLRDIFEGKRAA